MATQVSATTPRTRTAPRLGVLEVAILAVIAAAVVAVVMWSQIGTRPDVAVQSQAYGVGYPLHGGLAGPSRVSVFEGLGGFSADYPLHGGLAGPSRIGQVKTVDGPGGFAAGYPLRGGLAGPMSAVDLAGHYGPGYPLHGGLAGPSRADSGD